MTGVVLGGSGFSNVITTGQIILGALVAAAGITAVVYGAKWKATAESAIAALTARGEMLEDAKERETRLQATLAEAAEANAQARAHIEKLEAIPNMARVIETMSESVRVQEETRMAQFAQMDAHSAERTKEAVSGVLDHLDKRLERHETHARERHRELVEQGKENVSALREVTTALKKLNGGG